MSDHKILNEDDLLSSLDTAFDELTDRLDYEEHLFKQKVLEEVKSEGEVLEEQFTEITPTPQPIQQPEIQQVTPVDRMANSLSNYLTRTRTTKADEEVYKTSEDKRFFTIEQKIERLSRTILENTIVSGIGQGGDGQGPGSGEVRVLNMDDVDANSITDGQTLVWDTSSGNFVPTSVPGISSGVNTISAGDGIDVDPPNGVGDVTITLDASIDDLNDVSLNGISDGDALIWDNAQGLFVPTYIDTTNSGVTRLLEGDGIDLDPAAGVGEVEVSVNIALSDIRDVEGTPSNGDLLVYNGSEWVTGSLNTSELSLANPQGQVFGNLPNYSRYSVVANDVYTTQEDANILFVDLINDLDARIELLEPTPDPYDPYDPYEGLSVDKLAELEDVSIVNPNTGDLLVYDDSNGIWNSQTVDIPRITTGIALPATGDEKDGDIHYDTNDKELYVYTNVWEKVTSPGGVTISADPPDEAEKGDLWVETESYGLYTYDGNNWLGLTNDGLSGSDPVAALKQEMLQAVNSSTDYDSLKSALISVLSSS